MPLGLDESKVSRCACGWVHQGVLHSVREGSGQHARVCCCTAGRGRRRRNGRCCGHIVVVPCAAQLGSLIRGRAARRAARHKAEPEDGHTRAKHCEGVSRPTCVLFSTNSAMNLSSAVVTSGVSAWAVWVAGGCRTCNELEGVIIEVAARW